MACCRSGFTRKLGGSTDFKRDIFNYIHCT
jgi:hypothetical protein